MKGIIFIILIFNIIISVTSHNSTNNGRHSHNGTKNFGSKPNNMRKTIGNVLLNALVDIIKIVLSNPTSEIPDVVNPEYQTTETTTSSDYSDWNTWIESDTLSDTSPDLPYDTTSYLLYPDPWYYWCSYYDYVKSDYSNSNMYYLCVNYRWTSMSCPNGTLFNENDLACGNQCIKGLRKPRADPKPDSDSKYLECDGTTWIEKTCPYGEVFEVYSRRTCQTLTCYTSRKQAYPVDNTKYLQCKGHSWIEKSCTLGQIYNRYYDRCEDECMPGDKKNGYDMWDTLYTDQCGITRSCPGGGKYWSSLNMCISLKTNLTVSPTTTIDYYQSTENYQSTEYSKSSEHYQSTQNYQSTTGCECPQGDCSNNYGEIYFECEDGNWAIRKCLPGHTYYEAEIGSYCLKWDSCPYKARKELTELIPDLPIVTLNGSFYYECFYNGWEVIACPPGEKFDKGLLNCTKNPNKYTNQTVCPEGSKKANDDNTNAYYLCENNTWVPQTCTSGEVYYVGQCIYSPSYQLDYNFPYYPLY